MTNLAFEACRNLACFVFVQAIEDAVGRTGRPDCAETSTPVRRAKTIKEAQTFLLDTFWDSIWNDLLEWEKDQFLPIIKEYLNNERELPDLSELYSRFSEYVPPDLDEEEDFYCDGPYQEDEGCGEDSFEQEGREEEKCLDSNPEL